MRWRCDFCWVLNSDSAPICVRCGRDVMVLTKNLPKPGPGRPRIPDDPPPWDGVVRHKHPGERGYVRDRCRCPDCWDSGAKVRQRDRERKARAS